MKRNVTLVLTWLLRNRYGAAAFALCLVVRLWFMAHCNYPAMLRDDAGQFWARALRDYVGNVAAYDNWSVWPPAYHELLAVLFRALTLLHVPQTAWLMIVVSLQIVAASLGGSCVYGIARKVLPWSMALSVLVLYAFAWPLVYLNMNVLSEGAALPLALASLWLVLCRCSSRSRYWSGVLLALAVSMRPNLLLLLPCMVWYICPRFRFLRSRRVLLLPVACVQMLVLVCCVNVVRSNGLCMGLSNNAAVNFYYAQLVAYDNCSKLVAQFTHNGHPASYWVNAPDGHAGPVWTSPAPFSYGRWYWIAGLQTMVLPGVLARHLRLLPMLWTAPLYPANWGTPWQMTDLAWRSSGAWGCFLSMFGVPVLAILGRVPRRLWVLYAALTLLLVQGLIFYPERRYSLPLLWVVWVLSAWACPRLFVRMRGLYEHCTDAVDRAIVTFPRRRARSGSGGKGRGGRVSPARAVRSVPDRHADVHPDDGCGVGVSPAGDDALGRVFDARA